MRVFHVERPEGVTLMPNPPPRMPGVLAEVWLLVGRDLRVCVSLDPIHPIFGDTGESSYHLSASYVRRSPTWEELRDTRYALLPHVPYMAQILPPPDEYLNLHQYTHHLHEIVK